MGDFLDRAIRELLRYVALTTVTSGWYPAIRKVTFGEVIRGKRDSFNPPIVCFGGVLNQA